MANTTQKNKIGKWFKLIAFFIPLIGAIDNVLPFLLKRIASSFINKIPGLNVKLDTLSISFLRQKFLVKILNLTYTDPSKGTQTIKIQSSEIEITFNWRSLARGILKTNIIITDPLIEISHIKKSPEMNKNSAADVPNIRLPVVLESLTIKHGEVKYTDLLTSPVATLDIAGLQITLRNKRADMILEAEYKVNFEAQIATGDLKGDAEINLNSVYPAFDLNAKLTQLNLVKLNPFFEAYAKLEIKQGHFDLFTEAKAMNGKFKGYVKPLIKDLEVAGSEDKSIIEKLWGILMDISVEIFENPKSEKVATEIPFEGTFKDPKIKTGYAMVVVLVNAFIRALTSSFDPRFDKNTLDPLKDKL